MERKNSMKRWLWTFTLVAAAILLYKLYDNFAEAVGMVGRLIRVLAPFVGGFVLAFFMHGPSTLLEKQFLKLHGLLYSLHIEFIGQISHFGCLATHIVLP